MDGQHPSMARREIRGYWLWWFVCVSVVRRHHLPGMQRGPQKDGGPH